jgi:hypothetical protein
LLNCKDCGGKKWYAAIDKQTGLQRKHIIVTSEGVKKELRVWRCWRCGHTQDEVEPYVPLGIRSGASILYFDLEVSKSQYFNYGAKVPSKYLNIDDLEHEYYIISWSASYVGNPKIWSDCVTSRQAKRWSDHNILQPLRDLMAAADILAGHNVDAFDVRRANTRFLLNGIEPIIGKKTYDTLKIARSKFHFESNKLDYISQRLGLRPKDDIRNSDWLKIVRTGDEATLAKVNKYCRGDVRNGKGILERLMKYSGKAAGYGSKSIEAPPKWLKG